MGVGAATQDKKFLETAVEAMTEITGQKPIITLARKTVAGFRLARGDGHRLQGHVAAAADV